MYSSTNLQKISLYHKLCLVLYAENHFEKYLINIEWHKKHECIPFFAHDCISRDGLIIRILTSIGKYFDLRSQFNNLASSVVKFVTSGQNIYQYRSISSNYCIFWRMWMAKSKLQCCTVLRICCQHSENVSSFDINFMESGHSFLPNNSDFSNISDAMKSRSTIYTIDKYFYLIERFVQKKTSISTQSSMRF